MGAMFQQQDDLEYVPQILKLISANDAYYANQHALFDKVADVVSVFLERQSNFKTMSAVVQARADAARQAQRVNRAAANTDQRVSRRKVDAAAHALARGNESDAQFDDRRAVNAAAHALARANESDAQIDARRVVDTAAHALARANETPDEYEARLSRSALDQRHRRANETQRDRKRDESPRLKKLEKYPFVSFSNIFILNT